MSALEEKIVGFARPLVAKEVYLKLPKFKIEFRDELKETLEKVRLRQEKHGCATLTLDSI